MKKYISMFLSLALAATMCTTAFAAGGVTSYSDKIVGVIESYEGFRANVYEDPVVPGAYAIGYGITCGKDDYPDGITREEAEQLLKDHINDSIIPKLNTYLSKNGISLNQNQYDALVSFSYNLGCGWMNSGWRFDTYLRNGISNYTDVQIVDAMGVLAHANGKPVEGLVNRRIKEAKIFLYGDYVGNNSTNYCWVIADRNSGTMENDIFCYKKGYSYGSLPEISRSGYYFAGWRIDGTTSTLSSTTVVSQNLHVTAAWSTTPLNPYSDVKTSDWFSGAVLYCYSNGLMDGTTSTTFSPNTNMNRAMLVTVLWRMAGKPASSSGTAFSDVASGQWYTDAVRWASANGIVGGYDNGKFGTNDNVTREQMVTILYRFAIKQGKAEAGSGQMGLAGFSDASSISSYAYEAFGWAVREGVISGTTASTLSPKGTATRAQVAQVLQNYASV